MLVASLLTLPALAAGGDAEVRIDLVGSLTGTIALIIFAVAYLFVMLEEVTHLRKSKPVILAAGIIWALIALQYAQHGETHIVEEFARHNLLEYAELLLFLLVAMTYVNSLEERNVFASIRGWMVRRGFSLRQIFWLTGLLAFFISPVADNLTTALIMCAVLLAVGSEQPRFVLVGCVNVVVAANAGGAFSPFGDITTLMVWQSGHVDFWEFFVLFLPALVNWLIPASMMHFAVPNLAPPPSKEVVLIKRGGYGITLLFAVTIALAVTFHQVLHLPPVMGMFSGLALLQFYGYYLRMTFRPEYIARKYNIPIDQVRAEPFDIFHKVRRAEWDTLFFFYGVVMSVGGIGFMGYLAMTSELMYGQWGATYANIAVGVLSAIVDNIPVMFAVLTMEPEMSHGQWLLVTLTAGVGGSLLSVGSAAGVALMGQSRGMYTFIGHLKWTPVIALGYFASIAVHLWLNTAFFKQMF
ncbi:sodium:proton antiporter NhaD [Gammaproteobacteria bacterium]|nr:sodium:proton antiporter NhaD [Gammaproteobacteria bacterium]